MLKKLMKAMFGNICLPDVPQQSPMNKSKTEVKPADSKVSRAQMVKNMSIDTSKIKTYQFNDLNLPIRRELCLGEFYTVDSIGEKQFNCGFASYATSEKVGMRVVKIKIVKYAEYTDTTTFVIGEEKNGQLWRAFIQHEENNRNKVYTDFANLRWDAVYETTDGKYRPDSHLNAFMLETIEHFAKLFPNPQYNKLYSRFRVAVKKHAEEIAAR